MFFCLGMYFIWTFFSDFVLDLAFWLLLLEEILVGLLSATPLMLHPLIIDAGWQSVSGDRTKVIWSPETASFHPAFDFMGNQYIKLDFVQRESS